MMESIIKLTVFIINEIHKYLIALLPSFGFNFSDKELHFLVFGVIGFIMFILTDIIFKKIAKWNLSILSFIYTITILIILTLNIEIQQKITGEGNMEFNDVVAGTLGFVFIVAIYYCTKSIMISVYKFLKK